MPPYGSAVVVRASLTANNVDFLFPAVGKVTKMGDQVVKVEAKEEPAGDMSAYYSDDNSDDDFQPTKRKKVTFSRCRSLLDFMLTRRPVFMMSEL